VSLREADAEARDLLKQWIAASLLIHVLSYLANWDLTFLVVGGNDIAVIGRLAITYRVPIAWSTLGWPLVLVALSRLLIPRPPLIPIPRRALDYVISALLSVGIALIARYYIRTRSPLRDD
jgi:hypothetical protein